LNPWIALGAALGGGEVLGSYIRGAQGLAEQSHQDAVAAWRERVRDTAAAYEDRMREAEREQSLLDVNANRLYQHGLRMLDRKIDAKGSARSADVATSHAREAVDVANSKAIGALARVDFDAVSEEIERVRKLREAAQKHRDQMEEIWGRGEAAIGLEETKQKGRVATEGVKQQGRVAMEGIKAGNTLKAIRLRSSLSLSNIVAGINARAKARVGASGGSDMSPSQRTAALNAVSKDYDEQIKASSVALAELEKLKTFPADQRGDYEDPKVLAAEIKRLTAQVTGLRAARLRASVDVFGALSRQDVVKAMGGQSKTGGSGGKVSPAEARVRAKFGL
jgi:hypothetical protein